MTLSKVVAISAFAAAAQVSARRVCDWHLKCLRALLCLRVRAANFEVPIFDSLVIIRNNQS
jgi:hypothetical protein